MSCLEAPQLGAIRSVGKAICGAVARAARREAARAGKIAPLLAKRPFTYRCALLYPGYPGVGERVGKSSPGEHPRQVHPVLTGCVYIAERVAQDCGNLG